jgi:hypothetical protein
MTSGPKPSSAHTHSARLVCCGSAHVAMHGLPDADRRPAHGAHQPARLARAQRPLDGLKHTEHATMAERARRAASAARPVVSGYGMSHGKVFTMSTQGAW